MSDLSMRQVLLEVADRCTKKGPGYAQEYVVLREAVEQLSLESVEGQQELLTCWNDLFREGVLSWGYDVDNPGQPFFHFARREAKPEVPLKRAAG